MAIISYKADHEYIKTFGRHTRVDGMPAFDWSNSGLSFSFKGNFVSFSFAPFEKPETLYVSVKIGKSIQRYALSTGNEKVIIEGIREGMHEISLIKITEGEQRIVVTDVEIGGKNPKLLTPKAEEEKLKIEFIGDSLTAGYGNLAPATEKGFNTYQQDSTRAYAYLCAKLLGAEGHYVCYSGKGIHNDCTGAKSYEIPTFFTHASRVTREPWDFSLWTPDVVVINAGTNDFNGGVQAKDFSDTALEFLKQVRKAYPKALIIWCYGMTQYKAMEALEDTFSRLEDDNARFFKFSSIYERQGEVGGNGHPNAAAHVRFAKQMARFIKQEYKA